MSKKWTYNEGKTLINIYGNRKEEYFKTTKKKHFWEKILTDLESLNILVMLFFNYTYKINKTKAFINLFYRIVQPVQEMWK